MRLATRKPSGEGAVMPPPSPARPFRRAARTRSAPGKVRNCKVVMPEAYPTGSTNPPDPSRKTHLYLVARWSVALLGLWLTATAADETTRYQIENFAIPESLTGRPGDPARGERIVRDPDRATCLICHAMPIEGEPDPGNIGPPLHGIASRYTAGELRLRLVDPKRFNPETVMPSYFARDGFHRAAPEYRGRSIYTASEIEDVLAYLLTLTGG